VLGLEISYAGRMPAELDAEYTKVSTELVLRTFQLSTEVELVLQVQWTIDYQYQLSITA